MSTAAAHRSPLIAIDVVLLPPAEIVERAIRANRRLSDSDIRLERRHRVPHISLAMGVIARAKMPLVEWLMEGAASRTPPLRLRLLGAAAVPGARGHLNAWYRVNRAAALVRLHARLMSALAPWFEARPAQPAMFAEDVSRSTRAWVDRFAREAAYSRFRPHITLGSGRPHPEPDLPRGFVARRLAVFQLGDHCTCARPLFEARLRKS